MTWPIPNVGDPIPKETLTVEHPSFTARKELWKFFRASDELTLGYEGNVRTYSAATTPNTDVTSYLIPHTKEDQLDFAERVAHATPPRYVQEGITGITGVLTETEPNRSEYPDDLTEWMSAVNARGSTWQQVISTDIVPLVERYGLVYTLGRRPSIQASNLGEQEQLQADAGLPDVLVHVISPEAVPWWQEDDSGRLEVVHYIETVQDTTPVVDSVIPYPTENVTIERHWWVTDVGWWYTDVVGPAPGQTTPSDPLLVLETGLWKTDGTSMTAFPLVKWKLKDERPPTEPASFAQLAYYRTDSNLRSIELASAFPMLSMPTQTQDTNAAEILKSKDTVITTPETSTRDPFYLEPSGVSYAHFMNDRLPSLEEAALSPYGRQRAVGSNDSGVALAHIQVGAKRIYIQHSEAFGESEFAALQPITEMLGGELPDDARAEWNQKFGTLTTTEQTENLNTFLGMEPGEEYEEEIIRTMGKINLQMTPRQEETAIEAWKKAKAEAKAMESEQRDLELEQMGEDIKATGMPAASNPGVVGRETARENGE